MNRKRIICLILGILLCILPGTLIGLYILDFVILYVSAIYSHFSPESWLLVGMLVIGVVLIIVGLDIKYVENTK